MASSVHQERRSNLDQGTLKYPMNWMKRYVNVQAISTLVALRKIISTLKM